MSNANSILHKRAMARKRMRKYRIKLAYEKAVRDEIRKRSNQQTVNNHDVNSDLPNPIFDASDNFIDERNETNEKMIDFKKKLNC